MGNILLFFYKINNQNFMKSMLKCFAAITLLAVLIFACKKDKNGIKLGESASYGNGTVQTYALLDDAGVLTECGVIFDDAALVNLPKTPPVDLFQYFSASTDFPTAAIEQTGFQHMTTDYYPYGHNPDPIYSVEHIDFYWHYLTDAQRLLIGASAADSTKFKKDLPAGSLPPTFIDAIHAPMIGTELVNVAGPEFSNPPFADAFLYGKYDGKISFLEPMLPISVIKSVTTTVKSFNIPQPGVFPAPGKLFPTKYNISHDASKKQYKCFLSGFLKH
jgi:hypothetical protein